MHKALTVLALLGALNILTPAYGAPVSAGAAVGAPPPRVLVGQTPDVVRDGVATEHGPHDPAAPLTLNIGLAVRDSATLDGFIAAASDPVSPSYGHYLTQKEYRARFAPTDAEARAVRDWAGGNGLAVRAVSPDNLLVTVQGTSAAVERAFGVHIDDYRAQGRDFRANDRDPVVPAGLDIRAVSGLSTFRRFHTTLTRAAGMRGGGYYPGDLRAAYNMGPVGDAAGQTIGLTLWGAPVAQSDLHAFAANTGTTEVVAGQAGADGIDWIPVDGSSGDTSVLNETAMDVEYAHGAAPHSHLKYWLATTDPATCDSSGNNCQPTDVGLEDAVNAAANDPDAHVVSNSWGGDPATSLSDYYVSSLHASFQHAAAVGTTFYFASGDGGADSACAPRNPRPDCRGKPSYPADDPYVVSVGGTTLGTNGDGTYSAESVWNNASGASGGGCSLIFDRPSWQTGVDGATTQPGGSACARRAEPDVAADADPYTGAYVYVGGRAKQLGGTSLAAPLWAGMAADMNRYLTDRGQQAMGWAAPGIYALATNSATDARDFHDITSGNNGYAAGTGWDEATGWGSPNLANLAADWAGATGAVTATPIPSLTPAPSNTTVSTPGAAPSATPGVTCGLPCQPAASPTATGASISTATATRTIVPVPTSTSTATTVPSPTNTVAPAPTDTTAPTPTSTSSPTLTPTGTATPSPMPTVTALALGSPTTAPVATVGPSRPVLMPAGGSTPHASSATPTSTPAPRTTPLARQQQRRGTGPAKKPAVLATVGVPGAVTWNSVVTVSGQTQPGVAVSITADLTTTTTISRTIVVYVPAAVKGAGSRPRTSAPPTRTMVCRKGLRGCVARSVTRPMTRTTLLYHAATQARADRRGRFAARITLKYRAYRVVRATLTVTAATPRGRFTQSASITVVPLRDLKVESRHVDVKGGAGQARR